jgi:aminoglycoside phosphotransferase (APT) family kinase protein
MAKQEIGDLEEIRQKLEGWLASRIPNVEDFTLGELNFPEFSGESSVTLIMEANWQEAGRARHERFVLRMAPIISQVFETHDLKLQYQLMEVMNKEGIPAPSLVGYEPDSSLLGSDFYVMDFVDGIVPPDNPPMAFGSWVSELTTEERATMWHNGLTTMAKIHQIDIRQYDLPSLEESPADQSPLAHEITRYESMMKQGMREKADPIILEAWQYLKDNLPTDGPRRLVWGDSRPGNVIWKDLQPIAMIDWEIACIGDPLCDLTWWFWIDHCNSVGLGAEKMTGIPDYNDAYQEWHKLTGLPINNAAYFELFTIVRFAIIMERKLVHMLDLDPAVATHESHPVQFIQPLMDICKQTHK